MAQQFQSDFGKEISQLMDWFSAVSARLVDPPPDEITQIEAQYGKILPPDRIPAVNPSNLYRTAKALYPGKALTMGELSQTVEVPTYTATRIVNWWVDNGLAERAPDQKDRRVMRISLTPKGRNFHEAMVYSYSLGFQKVVNCLTDKERTTFITLLGKLVYNLERIDL